MAYLIGTDEAGYGPNLGPLAIGISVWRVDEPIESIDLYDRLAGFVASRPTVNQIAIADSKLLYKPGGGLTLLERAVLPSLRNLGHEVETWREVLQALMVRDDGQWLKLPWYRDFDLPLPVSLSGTDLEIATDQMRDGLAETGVKLCQLQTRVVFPPGFNDEVDQCGSKGQVLSLATLELVSEQLRQIDEPVLVICDKHGGRNKYGPLLQTLNPDRLVEVRKESRMESIYRWGKQDARVEIRFIAKGESWLPSALSSMAAKYVRELAMMAFNRFWCRQVPDLRPTAGYPVDARRFKDEIAAVQEKLGIGDRELWRSR